MFCIYCGKQIPDNSDFCSYCGKSLNEIKEADNTQVKEPIVEETPIEKLVEIPAKATPKKETIKPSAESIKEKTVKPAKNKSTSSNKNIYIIIAAVTLVVLIAMGIGTFIYISKLNDNKIVYDEEIDSDEDTAYEADTTSEEEIVFEETDTDADDSDSTADNDIPNEAVEEELPDDENYIDYDYYIERTFVRDGGPASYMTIYNMNDDEVMFSVGVGASGYLALRDERDVIAKWIDDRTVQYNANAHNYKLTFNDDKSITFLELSINPADMPNIGGTYYDYYSIGNSNYEYVFWNSDSRYLDESELYDLNAIECKIARNEIYARHGRKFQTEELQAYFESLAWYTGEIEAKDFSESVLNEYELANTKLIHEYEVRMGYAN